MDNHTLGVLDFPRICSLLAEGARSPQGQDLCLAQGPLPSREAATTALDELEALQALEPVLGMPPTAGALRVEAILDASRAEGTCLEIEALLAVRDTLGVCHRLLEYLEDAAAEGSLLGGYAGRMRPLRELDERFERTFGPRGEVLDNASSVLQGFRSAQRAVKARLLRVLQGVLRDAALEPVVQDEFITLRGGRYVVPLRTDFRGYLKGIVHDCSRTGSTFFVEPLETVELNNELGSLHEEELEEIRRILAELTRSVGRSAPALRANLAVLAHVDGLGARLILARRQRAVRPDLVEEPVLDVPEARHPLLEAQGAVVPVDLLLGPSGRLLLVTGANAGGKTVALKTAGLLAAMAYAGLFVPAREGARIGWFQGVYADIGDEQDLDRNLSTFSAHVVNVRDILARAGEGALVLLDELGTGTDPGEGAALAMAVLDELLDRGSRVLATTHLAALKAFAYGRPGAQNAAVAFDPVTGRPLYRLLYGQSGCSNALEVAERLGLEAGLVERARRYAAGGEGEGGTWLRDLEAARDRARREADEAEALRRRWEARCAEQDAALARVRRERDAARAESREQARAVLDEARGALRAHIRQFSEGQATQQDSERALAATEEALEEAFPAPAPEPVRLSPSAVAPGRRVRVVSLGKDGEVEAADAEGRRAVVRVGALRVTVPLTDIQPAERQTPEHRAARVRVVAEAGAGDVMVLGCTVVEALERVDRGLNRALVAGADGFRVVHGRGTGALRRAIRERLTAEPHVQEVRPEGDGATWVVLR
ncbi:MAG: endonuclease MutS2 [Deferrisomatales bacterium]